MPSFAFREGSELYDTFPLKNKLFLKVVNLDSAQGFANELRIIYMNGKAENLCF